MATRPRTSNPGSQRLRADLAAFGFVALLLWGVTFLPPDTTLAQVRDSGILRVCVPNAFPPLVTGDSERPGIDLELLEAVATNMGVRLVTVTNGAIGRDFNPRNWRVTRAQCLVLAGGIVDTISTRNFLVVTAPHLETGWAAVTIDPAITSLEGRDVGFFGGLTGLDRLALSRWLRDQGARTTVVSSARDAAEGLESGRFDVVVSEALTARNLADELDTVAVWLPPSTGGRLPLAFGMWKGDLTLERAIERELQRLRASGFIDALVERYDLSAVEDVCDFCR